MTYHNLLPAWMLRLMIVVILVPHALGKVLFADTFSAKFDLSMVVTYLTSTAEFASALGMVVGGILLVYSRWGQAWIVTLLATVCVWIVQVGAIAMVHWPVWLYYMGDHGGMEYNVTILVVSLSALLLTPFREPYERPLRVDEEGHGHARGLD